MMRGVYSPTVSGIFKNCWMTIHHGCWVLRMMLKEEPESNKISGSVAVEAFGGEVLAIPKITRKIRGV